MDQVGGSLVARTGLMHKIDSILDNIKNLPPAPQVLPKLLSALTEADSDVDRVVDLIALDPAMTAKLLQTCNSAFYGMDSPVNDTAEAVNRLGFQVVYRTVATVSAAHCLKVSPASGLDAGQFWKHSVITAFAAQYIAEGVGADAGLHFTAALLHDLGKVVLAEGFGNHYRELLSASADAFRLSLEKAAYGADHADVGARLLERWKFSAPLVSAVRFHHDPGAAGEWQRTAACVCLANALAHNLDQSPAGHKSSITAPEAALTILELTAEDLARHRELIIENWTFVEGMCRLQS
jgi:putative nucleotidyltransferase with HDIG domain